MNIKEYIKTQLNEEQTKAALHIDTSSLIIAGAGSGKTRTLIYKIAYLIRGKNIPVHRILAVTFTNKAANEMKERLLKISEEIPSVNSEQGTTNNQEQTIGTSNDSIDGFLSSIESSKSSQATHHLNPHELKWIGTFHSIFLKILKEDIDKLYSPNPSKIEGKNKEDSSPILGEAGRGKKGYNKNFGIYDPNETQTVIKDVLKRLNLQEIYKPNEVKGFISTQKNNGLDSKSYIKMIKTDYDQSMAKIYEEYQKDLENSNSLDFDDLLLLPFLLFKKHPEILTKWQQKFDYILVDEAQDTNWIQFELIKMLSVKNANVTLIGDDFQSIYGWRGALMENFLNVKQYRPDIQMFKLQINYRSRPHIVDAGNHIIKNNLNQYKKNVVANRTGDDKITIFSHGSEIDEAANIVDLIRKMKDQGKYEDWNQIAILYRTNAQSSPFEQLFLQEGIPYKVWGAFKFFERKEIKDTLSYIKYLLNPQNNVSLKRIINIPTRKIGKTSINNIEEFAIGSNTSMHEVIANLDDLDIKLTPQATKGIKEFSSVMNSLRKEMETLKPAAMIESLVKKIKYREYLIKEEGGEAQADEKYENIGQLINMAEKYNFSVTSDEGGGTSQNKLDTSNSTLGTDLLRAFMEEVTLLSDISENESGEIEAVKLMTVHSSKGLEFPIVFVVGLEDYIFPLANAMLEPKTLEEERRLMYVAVTRAKDMLFLSHAHSRMTWGQTKMNPPSRFLDEIPDDLLKKYDLGGGAQEEAGGSIDEGDNVRHKLFGTGYVLEVWNNLAIVKFHSPKFGVRKVEQRFLDVI